jgi:hypothetical protein
VAGPVGRGPVIGHHVDEQVAHLARGVVGRSENLEIA